MRRLCVLALAACGHEPPSGGTLAIRGPCAHPLGPAGEIMFPDAGAQKAQTATLSIDVINTGVSFDAGRELIVWSFEGDDADDFTVVVEPAIHDPESCGFQSADSTPFPSGSFCRLDLAFQSRTEGDKHTTLRAAGFDQTFPVRATAVAPPTGLYATTPELYTKPWDTVEVPQFVIVNAGTNGVELGYPLGDPPFNVFGDWGCPTFLDAGRPCNAAGVMYDDAFTTFHGCPIGTLTTTSGAISVTLTSRLVP